MAMNSLSAEQQKLIRAHARDDASYQALLTLFEQQNAALVASAHAQEVSYRAMIDHQPELICRYLPDATLTFVNEAFCRFFGRSAEALVGQRFDQFQDDATAARIRSYLNQYLEDPTLAVVEIPLRRHDGDLRQVEWTLRPIRDG